MAWRSTRCLARTVQILTGAVALLLGLEVGAKAQVPPNGGEFQVNTYTTNAQTRSSVAADAQGDFVVVWHSQGSSGTDTSYRSVLARRYDASGTPLGSDFQVNTYTTGYQYNADVATDSQGGFVVVWESVGSAGTDNDNFSIQVRRYDTDGTPLGAEFQVNTYTFSQQRSPRVAVDAQGEFVVVWASFHTNGNDTTYGIQVRRFDADGTPAGAEYQVNSYTTGGQRFPRVACDAQGNFVVVWESSASAGTDSSFTSIQAQRYDANGAPAGGEFQVNTYTSYRQKVPAVAVDPVGNFVVAWASEPTEGGGTDNDLYSIQAQRYDADGAPLGGQFQVNTETTDIQFSPALSADSQGRFLVAWQSDVSSGNDSSAFSVQAQLYNSSGTPMAGQFQVNSYTTSGQYRPALSFDEQGNFVVAWTSDGSNGADTSFQSIQAQRYGALFRDGFASGDTSQWSSTTP